jgi:hypothetical protein
MSMRRLLPVTLAVAATAAVGAVALGPAHPAAAGSWTRIGSGADELLLQVSEQAYQGDARFTVEVDGTRVGDELTATAAHGADSDTVGVRGDWGPGDHRVTVTFVNDLWVDGGGDRNLYLDGVSYQGRAIPDSARDLTGWYWSADIAFGGGTPAPAFVESFDDGVGALAHTWGDSTCRPTCGPGPRLRHLRDGGEAVRRQAGAGAGAVAGRRRVAGPGVRPR